MNEEGASKKNPETKTSFPLSPPDLSATTTSSSRASPKDPSLLETQDDLLRDSQVILSKKMEDPESLATQELPCPIVPQPLQEPAPVSASMATSPSAVALPSSAVEEPVILASKRNESLEKTNIVPSSVSRKVGLPGSSMSFVGRSFVRSFAQFKKSVGVQVKTHKASFAWVLGLLIAVFVLFQIPVFERFELDSFDSRFQLKRNVAQSKEIVLLDIQDECIQEYGEWPWSRNIHAATLKTLQKFFEPRMVGFDILFLESGAKKVALEETDTAQSNNRLSQYDTVFSKVIRSCNNVYLPGVFDFSEDRSLSLGDRVEAYHPPYSLLAEGMVGTGHISYQADPDGKVRRVPLLLPHEGILIPHLAFRMALDYLGVPLDSLKVAWGKEIVFKDKNDQEYRIPIDRDGQMLLAWAGLWKESFRHEAFRNIRQAQAGETLENVKSRVDPKSFNDKILLIGYAAATGALDIKPTPLERNYPMVGVHATVINQILNREFIHVLPLWGNVLICFGLALGVGFSTLRLSPLRGMAVALLSGALLYFISVGLFLHGNLWIEQFRPLLTIGLTFLILGTYNHVQFKNHVDLKLSFAQKLNMADAKLPQFRANLKIGNYGNISELGRGGMAIVYRGTGKDGKEVAIKVINPEFLNKEGFKFRFKREVQTMKRVQHPNVIRVFDSGSYQGVLYYAMELFPAGDLGDQIKELSQLTDWEWLRQLLAQLVSGMKAIHDAGLIHRDIKPANIMMNDQKEVKIADFGLARPIQDDHLLTTVGQVVGTPVYLSPELCTGDDPTYGADIYAMGIVFYEVISGHRPFQECNTIASLMQAKMRGSLLSVKARRPEIPDALATIVDKMVAFKLSDRYQSCADILRDLQV